MVEQGVVEIISNLADSYQEVITHHLQSLKLYFQTIANAILSLICIFFNFFSSKHFLSIKLLYFVSRLPIITADKFHMLCESAV
jgi:hypothetical protein